MLLLSILATAYVAVVDGSPIVKRATPTRESFATSVEVSLHDYWNIYVGPVAVAATTTTVSPTAVPTQELIPPPPLGRDFFPSERQVPISPKNTSWAFPRDFWWGVASAAYQIEGAAKAEGRGPSIWDVLTHRVTNYIADNSTGDVGDNQYYLYKQDIVRIAAMGVPYYSFSISWSRIFPFGRGQINEQGLKHYDDLIQTCLDYNVKPLITLYHWDMPLHLQNLYGGWLGSEVVDDFTEYARILFDRWGSKIEHWFTVNEPIVFCSTYPLPADYFSDQGIPALHQKFWCAHHVILAHASAYRLAKSMPGFKGTVSFKTNGGYKIPLTDSIADAEAVQRAWDFNEGWFADPIFLNGDYPATVKDYVKNFLPDFTQEQKQMIKGSSDIFAHDAYTSQFYFAPDGGIAACLEAKTKNSLYPGCFNSSYTYAESEGGWAIGASADVGSPWLHKATDWVPQFLKYIQETWEPRGGVAVTEFGFSEPYENLRTLLQDIRYDIIRSSYYRDYMEAILIAISEGVNVVGCLAWSIADNLEWQTGYSTRFGMQYVNFTSPGLERSYKASFFWYTRAFQRYQVRGD